MVATIQMDTKSYNEIKAECLKNLDFEGINWVSDYPDETILYKKAYDEMVKGKGSFQHCLSKSEYVKPAI